MEEVKIMKEKIMSPEEFKEKMEGIKSRLEDDGDVLFDEELAHRHADILMMKLLVSLGYREGIIVFEDMEKWYN